MYYAPEEQPVCRRYNGIDELAPAEPPIISINILQQIGNQTILLNDIYGCLKEQVAPLEPGKID